MSFANEAAKFKQKHVILFAPAFFYETSYCRKVVYGFEQDRNKKYFVDLLWYYGYRHTIFLN